MSLSQSTLEAHLNDPAVLCCQRPAGTVLGAQDFEDPAIFDDMIESNLMTLTRNGLTIGQAFGATLTSGGEALTQLTPDLLDGVAEISDGAPTAPAESPAPAPEAPLPATTSEG
ncbi:MAG: D-proline reductase (dithiol) proprotein PrdA, partial [Acidipropionibacterium acidipropionici]|nr:D-proline reductase (dithiol) proprotein PrdA [Acidipropionibacterium acidipropionici]